MCTNNQREFKDDDNEEEDFRDVNKNDRDY